MIRLTLVAGARPNFMKISPIIRAIDAAVTQGAFIQYRLVHTGQHYDAAMSDSFFEQLQIPKPDINLGCGGGTQAEQTAAIMMAFEKELTHNPCDYVLVVGDVTSTMACSIVAKKLNTKVIHVEAGIRSFDLTMPEEINRMVTDRLTDIYFTTSKTACENLANEGIPESRIHFVGNVMIDTLLRNKPFFRKPELFNEQHLQKGKFLVITIHRPSNVDDGKRLKDILNEILANCRSIPVIFPVHPRTARVLEKSEFRNDDLILSEPLGYLEFNWLVSNSLAVITDSGGITEETTVMGIPCMTLRDNTERPETCTIGTNELIGTKTSAIKPALDILFNNKWKTGSIPEKWDGHAAERLVKVLIETGIQ
jgi:UDP-N-acetylglucosamine 2-epimerase (non-hydrolysing)